MNLALHRQQASDFRLAPVFRSRLALLFTKKVITPLITTTVHGDNGQLRRLAGPASLTALRQRHALKLFDRHLTLGQPGAAHLAHHPPNLFGRQADFSELLQGCDGQRVTAVVGAGPDRLLQHFGGDDASRR